MSKIQTLNIPEVNTVAISDDPNALMKLKTTLGLIIAAFAFLLYAQSISFDYNLDDGEVIQSNKSVQKGFAGIPTIMTTDRFFGLEDQSLRTPEYRPASFVMFAIEWQFFPNNPHIGHFMNVLLYALSCWLLYLLLCKLFENTPFPFGEESGVKLLFPFISALLYALHPIHTEVVDNIKSRDEILCFLFALLSVILFIKTIKVKSVLYLILAGICYFISLLSKETAISFLIIIPLLLFVFTSADAKKIGTITIFLVFISGIFLLIRAKVLESVPPTNFNLNNNSLSIAPDFISQKATAFYVLWKYIILLIFPHPLSYDYSFAQIPIQSLSNPLSILAILVYFGAGIYAVINIRKRDPVAFAILFYLLTLVPVSNIFLLIGSPMSERFLYMPSLGFCMLITFLLLKITKAKTGNANFKTIKEFVSWNIYLFAILLIVGGLYSFKTLTRNPDWENSISLYGHDVEVSINSARTHFHWGISLLTERYPKEQNNSIKNDLLNHAVKEFKTTISIYPNHAEAHINLADAYMKLKDYPNAIKNYEIINRHFSKPNPIIYNNLGFSYQETGQLERAFDLFDSAIKMNQNFLEAYANKGNILFNVGEYSEAIPCFQKVIDLNPKKVSAYKMISDCYLSLHDTIKAKEYFEHVAELNGGTAKIKL